MHACVLHVSDSTVTAQDGDHWGDFVGRRLEDLFVDCQDGLLPPAEQASLRHAGGKAPVTYQIRSTPTGFELHLHDAESQRNAFAAIVTSERQLREAQEVGGIGSWVWDIVNDKITWTDQLYRIYGLEPQQFPATFEAYMERIHPDDVELAQGVVQKAFQDMAEFSFDHRIIRPDGEVRILHGQGAVAVEDGKPVRMYGVSQDITQMRMAEQAAAREAEREAELKRLQAIAKAREEAFNVLAHELKTPLTPMAMQVELLHMGKLGDVAPTAKQSLEIIAKNIDRLIHMTGEMLDVARISQGSLTVDRKPTDVAAVVIDATTTFQTQATEEGKHLEVNAAPGQAHIDEHRIGQVIINLVSNALKFSDPGGHIRVDARVEDDVIIQVSDDGLGLDEAQRSRLFEPFARVHLEAGRVGTGLGLHVCKGIVEQHGGTITCHSDGPGLGARFEVRIPAQAPS